jgi:hypothetical protein
MGHIEETARGRDKATEGNQKLECGKASFIALFKGQKAPNYLTSFTLRLGQLLPFFGESTSSLGNETPITIENKVIEWKDSELFSGIQDESNPWFMDPCITVYGNKWQNNAIDLK